MANYEKNTSAQGLFLAIQLEDQFDSESREYILKQYILENVKPEDFDDEYKNDHGGRKVKYPLDVLAAILYGYITGNRSSRKIESLLQNHIGFMFISNRLKIDHSILCEFKVKFRKQIEKVFSRLLLVMNEMGAIDWKIIVSDGTKIKAYASKDQNIGKGFTEKLLERYHKLAAKIVQRDIELDAKKDEGGIDERDHGAEKKRIERQKRVYDNVIRNINRHLADEEKKKRQETERVNMTDPESALMPDSSKKGFIQGYNALLSISNNDVILDFDPITDGERNHTEAIVNKIEELKQEVGSTEKSVHLMDSGFEDMEKIQRLQGAGHAMYVDVKEKSFSDKSGKRKDFSIVKTETGYNLKCRNGLAVKGYYSSKEERYTFLFERKGCEKCPFFGECYQKIKPTTKQKTVIFSRFELENRPAIDGYLEKLRSPDGQKVYSKRIGKEHVNANIKGQRNFQQTYYRGKELVRMDLCWVALAHNLSKYANFVSR